MLFELKNEELTVTVSDIGAELMSARSIDGFEYVCDGKKGDWKYRAPILFPICGRLRNARYSLDGKEYQMDIHGFAKDCEFEVSRESDTEILFTLTDNDKTRAMYPFAFKLSVFYRLAGRALTMKITVENTGDAILPYMVGWHPGFALAEGLGIGDYTLDLGIDRVDRIIRRENSDGTSVRAAESVALTGGKYPLSEESLEKYETTIFKSTDRHVTLCTDRDTHAVRISWGENLRYLCVWKWPSADATFLCLEPWTELPTIEMPYDDFAVKKMTRMASGGREEYLYSAEFI